MKRSISFLASSMFIVFPLVAARGQAPSSSPPVTRTVVEQGGRGPAIAITEWTLPHADAKPLDTFVSRRDAFVWYSAPGANILGRFNPKTEAFEEFPLRPGSDPYGFVEHFGSGIQTTVYFTSRTGGFVGEFDMNTREVQEFRLEGGAAVLHDLTFDPNGDLWFTMTSPQPPRYPQGSKIGRLNVFSREIRLAETPTPNASPYALAVNSSGTPFFSEVDSPRFASVHPMTFKVTEYALPSNASRVRGLALTPDDLVWYTDTARGYLGRFDPKARKFDEWPSPGGPNSRPSAIVSAGSILWYVEAAPQSKLVRFDARTQEFQSWALQATGDIDHLYAHTDGSVWFANAPANRIVRITVATDAR